jgi:integrase
MARNKLSETKIKSLTKPGIYSDGDGLYLRVRTGGSRQWIFIHKRGGIRSETGLGGYGQGTAPVSLALAREKADELRHRLARGDKLHDRKTFAEVMDDVLDVKLASSKNKKHQDQWSMTLRTYAAPLHNKAISDITRDDVLEVLKPIWTKIPETADRTRQRIAMVFEHASARGLYSGDNPAAWRGGLKELLPARKKLSKGHHEAIAYKDLPAVVSKLRASEATSARALEFLALTATRSNEARSAVWSEINFPAARMKAARPHEIPLSDRAIEILKERQERATGDLIFEGDKENTPISDTAMVKVFRAAGAGKATLHGLRSSFRDWCGDETDYPRDIAEAALAHRLRDKTEAAYRRGTALAKRRSMMNDWASFLA